MHSDDHFVYTCLTFPATLYSLIPNSTSRDHGPDQKQHQQQTELQQLSLIMSNRSQGLFISARTTVPLIFHWHHDRCPSPAAVTFLPVFTCTAYPTIPLVFRASLDLIIDSIEKIKVMNSPAVGGAPVEITFRTDPSINNPYL